MQPQAPQAQPPHVQPPQAAIAASLRRERQRAGLSLTEVARRAGIAKSTLSQLESGSGNPSVETLWAICVALEVPFSRLLDPPRPAVTVIRAGEGPTFFAAKASYLATLLSACPPGARRDMFRVVAEPGPPKISDPHLPGTVEYVVICTGRALVGLVDSPVELGPGDYICYPADVAHTFQALEPGTEAVLLNEYVLPAASRRPLAASAGLLLRPAGLARHTGTSRPASTTTRPINAEVYRIAEVLPSYTYDNPPRSGNTPRYPPVPAPRPPHHPHRQVGGRTVMSQFAVGCHRIALSFWCPGCCCIFGDVRGDGAWVMRGRVCGVPG
jgi:transcriptional regulator with XRE-family HTH domain